MSNLEIIEDLARRRVVERICDGVTRRRGSPDSQDLSQYVYEVLLMKTQSLEELESVEAFVYKIAFLSWTGKESPFFRSYRRYGMQATEFDENGAG